MNAPAALGYRTVLNRRNRTADGRRRPNALLRRPLRQARQILTAAVVEPEASQPITAEAVAAALVDHTAGAMTLSLVVADAAAAAQLEQVCAFSAELRARLVELEDALAPAIQAGVAIDAEVVALWLQNRLVTSKYEAGLICGQGGW